MLRARGTAESASRRFEAVLKDTAHVTPLFITSGDGAGVGRSRARDGRLPGAGNLGRRHGLGHRVVQAGGRHLRDADPSDPERALHQRLRSPGSTQSGARRPGACRPDARQLRRRAGDGATGARRLRVRRYLLVQQRFPEQRRWPARATPTTTGRSPFARAYGSSGSTRSTSCSSIHSAANRINACSSATTTTTHTAMPAARTASRCSTASASIRRTRRRSR